VGNVQKKDASPALPGARGADRDEARGAGRDGDPNEGPGGDPNKGPGGGQRRELSVLERVSYGFSEMGGTFSFAFSSYYLLSFYTDAYMMPAAAIAAIMFAYRIVDALDDQIIAFLINRRPLGGGGKYRPYFLWLSAPFAVSSAMVFYTPPFGGLGKILYAFATLVIWEALFTTLNTASSALLPYVSRDGKERAALNSIRTICSVFAFIAVSSFGLPLAASLGGASGQGGLRRGFFLTAAVFGVASVPMHVTAYFNLKERHFPQRRERASIKAVFANISGNRRMLCVMGMYMLYWLAAGIRNQMAVFYMAENVGRREDTSAMLMIGVLAALAMNIAIPYLIRRARRDLCMLAGLVAAAGAMLLLLPAGGSFAAIAAATALFGGASAMPASLVFLAITDFIDEDYRKSGLSASEIYFSSLNFCAKIGMAIAGGLCPFVMSRSGYVPGAGTQGAPSLLGIKALYIGGTALFLLLSAAMMIAAVRSGKAGGLGAATRGGSYIN
jgi:sugar (glycoside-pentoside-hexuronide) transporter